MVHTELKSVEPLAGPVFGLVSDSYPLSEADQCIRLALHTLGLHGCLTQCE